MFQRKTVFVVGAGGSKELGLPMGDELKTRIASKLLIEINEWGQITKLDPVIRHSVERIAAQVGADSRNPWWQAARSIRAAMPLAISIDNFLHAHAGDQYIEQMGKLGIAACILDAERSTKLFTATNERSSPVFSKVEQSWHSTFCKMLFEEVQRGDVGRIFENISFIVFNYDRCIEHYFMYALCSYFRMEAVEAQAIVRKLNIIHPYGQVGLLPWMSSSGNGIEFGKDIDQFDLPGVAAQIRTFTERVDDTAMMERLYATIGEAEKVVYLGFSYGRMNLELLTLPSEWGVSKRIYGTTFGLSPQNVAVIGDDLTRTFGKNPKINGVPQLPASRCDDILNDYARELVR